VNAIDELLGRRVSLRALSLLRVLVGPITVLHLWPVLDDARHGHLYRDGFHQPHAAWYPELPRSLYVAVLVLGAAAAIGMTIGVLTRVSSVVAFAVVTYNLLLSTTHFHNNRAYLVVVLAALAAAPGDDGPAWPLWLLRVEASVVYLGSSLSKLFDADWFGGTVTWGRVVRVQDRLPSWAAATLTNRSFHTGAAKVIVLTELFLALGLWLPRTRLVAVWVAVCFHIAIQLTAHVQTFSVLCISALVIWATPRTGDRIAVVPERWRRAIESLDWLGRFRVEPGTSLAVLDRDGTTWTGRPALALLLSRLPLTAWFALPFLAVYARRVRSQAASVTAWPYQSLLK
jgi:hypothetical protein